MLLTVPEVPPLVVVVSVGDSEEEDGGPDGLPGPRALMTTINEKQSKNFATMLTVLGYF